MALPLMRPLGADFVTVCQLIIFLDAEKIKQGFWLSRRGGEENLSEK
jgi:hypothetical protein